MSLVWGVATVVAISDPSSLYGIGAVARNVSLVASPVTILATRCRFPRPDVQWLRRIRGDRCGGTGGAAAMSQREGDRRGQGRSDDAGCRQPCGRRGVDRLPSAVLA